MITDNNDRVFIGFLSGDERVATVQSCY